MGVPGFWFWGLFFVWLVVFLSRYRLFRSEMKNVKGFHIIDPVKIVSFLTDWQFLKVYLKF